MGRVGRFEGPCTKCTYKTGCSSYVELKESLFKRRAFQEAEPSDAIVDVIVDAMTRWVSHRGAPRTPGRPWTVRLAAFFDLAASLLYASYLVAVEEGEYRFIADGVTHEDSVVFPYTWVCPLCIAEGAAPHHSYLPCAREERDARQPRDYPDPARLAKPGSRAIGDVGFTILLAILRGLFCGSNVRVRSGGGQRGEFDLTLADNRALVFGEVKAKPLVCFPLVVGRSTSSAEHTWVTPEVSECWLHVGGADLMVPLGRPDGVSWPINRIVNIASDAAAVRAIEEGWYRHLEAYKVWKSEPEQLRWVRFGCGNFRSKEGGATVEKRVANTKELPGLDRTDDIKKGSAQLLLMSRLKFGCEKRALKSVLFGNTYAETHGADYLDRLSRLRVTNEDATRHEFIFDAILGFTRNVLNDKTVTEIVDGVPELGRGQRL